MTLVCTVCGSRDVIAAHPGMEPTRVELVDVFVHPGAPLTAWCLACWPNCQTTMGKLMHGEEKGRRRRARD
jgi:hypothetical protein